MARSWVGLTILACLPCMEMLRSIEAHNSYINCQNAEECYECAIMSSKNLCQTRSTPTLRHKGRFAYEWVCRGGPTACAERLTRCDITHARTACGLEQRQSAPNRAKGLTQTQ